MFGCDSFNLAFIFVHVADCETHVVALESELAALREAAAAAKALRDRSRSLELRCGPLGLVGIAVDLPMSVSNRLNLFT